MSALAYIHPEIGGRVHTRDQNKWPKHFCCRLQLQLLLHSKTIAILSGENLQQRMLLLLLLHN
jgi:hypothetical protein